MPFAHMQELRSLSKAPTTWLENARSGHMDAYVSNTQAYWEAMGEFWSTHVLSREKTTSQL